MKENWIRGLLIVSVLAAVWSTEARATWIPGSPVRLVQIEATSGTDTGAAAWLFPADLAVDGVYDWTLALPTSLQATDGRSLGTIKELEVTFAADPAVSLNFNVDAGSTDTTFTITSAVISFDPIVNPLAFATAALTITDNDYDGATVTGLLPGQKAYQAIYNGSVTWANLVDPVTAAINDSAIGRERRPAVNREMIPATVSSIQSQFKFTVTSDDSVSGTSRFDVIVPEPATLALLTLGGLTLLRRRRA